MCGINGVLRLTPQAPEVDAEELRRTRDAQGSRGPDGAGLWIDPDGRVGLGHRRLAIIDLSPAAAQPMAGADGRYVVVFNGEIYNYRDLRQELVAQGRRFRTHSDTEVLIALFDRDGPGMVDRLRGMYAFALWDGKTRRLHLARDPFGIKPLYYARSSDELRFASQVRALEASGRIAGGVDAGALAGFLLWGSVPEPRTLRPAIRALPAGHWLEIGEDRPDAAPRPFATRPWEAAALDDGDSAGTLEASVKAHLVSDVPVGVFLSAGMDSAAIAALVVRHSEGPPSTFTLAFDEFAGTPRDEAPGARRTAEALGTRHVERRLSPAEFDELFEAALGAMDQPSIDGINTYMVSRCAREAGLKVVLSGLGGDELLGGYPSFRDVPRWARWARLGRSVPGAARAWPILARFAAPGLPKLAGLLEHGSTLPGAYFLRRGLFLPEELPGLLGPLGQDPPAGYDPVADARAQLPEDREQDAWQTVGRLETGCYLRNQLLRDADWASMAHGLEIRVPFVDGPLWSRVARAGFEPARSHGKAAWMRRAVPELPGGLESRPKSGFLVPVAERRGLAGRTGSGGAASRRLALEVLRAFGIELPGAGRSRPRSGSGTGR